ncbi:hypothetical protein QBC32DRAFT_354927 [Pseudoneurospora amorphoporcata]|uniref:EamA domain-containing protein n=1 Tax=Pseudoneurospora amorphoporcata TaxID=241081 RepID=A0AAN6SB75_9PEZI|nr:hypothetical protein QBC32DRAFT_354927 [Pseudoneurospora amorphoporcata]
MPPDTHSSLPLLNPSASDDRGRRRPASPSHPSYDPSAADRPPFLRRTTPTSLHSLTSSSSNPLASQALALDSRLRYRLAAFFLVVSLVTFTVQTELASIIQHDLGWDKAYSMLYLTHGSWIFLFPLQLGVLRLMKREMPWRQFWRGLMWEVRVVGSMVQHQRLDVVVQTKTSRAAGRRGGGQPKSPWRYLAWTTAGITCALTVAGLSWYLAVSMTTPSDLTAIYNCSAFFAYAFSIPLLKEKPRMGKILAVAIAIIGVLVVAYGDSDGTDTESESKGAGAGDDETTSSSTQRFLGNLIIGIGSVLYGLYEVLYKRFACPPEGTSAFRSVTFANTFGSMMGVFTVFVLWIPIPILHWTGIEPFEVPTGRAAWLLFWSIVMNMGFSGSFLVLISLTSPVFSSVASLLTIFIVAVSDWFVTGKPLSGASMVGGVFIMMAFGLLSWSTWKEIEEEEEGKRRVVAAGGSGEEEEEESDSDKDED